MAVKSRPQVPTEPRAVQVITCDSWEDFKVQLRKEHEGAVYDRDLLYRGHAKADWKLASPWERVLERHGPVVSQEESSRSLAKLLENFQDMAIGLPGIRTVDLPTDDHWWTLGRHYGLVTPLLDWTMSPYVAAFFAFTALIEQVSPGATTIGNIDVKELVSKKSAAKVAIWSFESQRASREGGLPQGLEILNSRTDIGHRQRAQRGVFTRLTHDSHLCLEDYLESLQPDLPLLRKYLVPGWGASAAIRELRMMNITFATLFPDLTGAVLQANFELAMPDLNFVTMIQPDDWNSIVGETEEQSK